MTQEKYILVSHFCKQTHIKDSFVKNLQEYGLVTFEVIENDIFIAENDISEIERMFRLHNELNINIEGLDALQHMLKRMRKLEKEMNLLKKRLRLYE